MTLMRGEVTAFKDKDWAALEAEYTGANGSGTPAFDAAAHNRRRDEFRVLLVRGFWFDVTVALDA